MKKSRADYDWYVDADVICITDLNLGNMSVTNDVENVLEDIQLELQDDGFPPTDLDSKTILYKDSDGRVDGLITQNNKFLEFLGIGAENFEQAKTSISS